MDGGGVERDGTGMGSSRDDRIVEWMVESGRLTRDELERARLASESSGDKIEKVLVSLGLIEERELAESMALALGLPLARSAEYPSKPVATTNISIGFLRTNKLLPMAETAEGIVVAAVDPRSRFALDALGVALRRPIIPCVGVPAEIEEGLERIYGRSESELCRIVEGIDYDGGVNEDVERLRDQASEAPVIRIVDFLVNQAVEAGASDIHIEPFEARMRVRYRIDGVLREVEGPPARFCRPIVSRIKLIARLDIAERRLPQDGRLRQAVRGREIDFRVSTMPTMHGEEVVLRVLDRGRLSLDFASLGFSPASLRAFRDALERPNGIVLVTGPTGSGKTSTLYTALLALNSPERKIVTAEDPIEYELAGVNQIQIRPQVGLTFASVLRSVLRHDPDIVMIGEIRDLETAEISIQAALTGHLVLSTVHTNGAAATVTRLLDMGVEPYLLTSTLNGIVAQRLVRRLCPNCREPYQPLPELVSGLGLDPARPLHRAKGCTSCQGYGYHGRLALVEMLPVSDPIRRLILARAEVAAIERAAREDGMRGMQQDGLEKAQAGFTTLDEVLRVTREA